MTDFSEMAKAAKTKSQSIVDAAEAAKQEEQRLEIQRLKEAEDILHCDVLPILRDASAVFLADAVRIDASESKSWRVLDHPLGATLECRSINFQCTSLKETKPNGDFVSSDPYAFEHDGKSLSWKVNHASGSGVKFTEGDIDKFVANVIEQALESYYRNLRSNTAR